MLGPTNLPSTVPYHASQMYAKNISTLLLHLTKDGALTLDTEDEITAGTLVSRAAGKWCIRACASCSTHRA